MNSRKDLGRTVAVIALCVSIFGVSCAPAVDSGNSNGAQNSASEALRRRPKAPKATFSQTTSPPTETEAATPSPSTTDVAPPTTAVAAQPDAGNGGQSANQPTTYVSNGTRLGVGGCEIFPRDNAFHADIGSLSPRSDSAAVIQSMGGTSIKVRPSFSAGVWQGSRSGIPVNVVDSRTSQIVDFVGGEYSYLSDLRGHPMPANPRYEGWPGIAWDRHLLVVDSATCISSEFFYVTPAWMNPFGYWVAQTAVKIDLSTNAPRARGATTASGLSMLAGMVRYDEVATGSVGHTIAMAIPEIKKSPPVWPAFGTDGRSTDPNAPAMGSWMRLKSGTDISALGPQARVIAKALKEHGAVVADTNSHGLSLGGEPDTRWDDADLATLQTLSAADFEVVDPTPMIVDPTTMQIR